MPTDYHQKSNADFCIFLKTFKGTLSGLGQLLATESPLKRYPENCLPRKTAPLLGLGFGSRLGLVLGFGWQPDNCPRGKQPTG